MRTVNLKPNGAGRYDDVSPFIITDRRLELKIALPNYNGEFYLVYGAGGRVETKLLGDGNTVLENLSAGELNAEVKHYLKGELIKVYKIEPLILKEADGRLSAEPEISELRRRLASLEKESEEHKNGAYKAFDGLSGRLAETEKNIAALKRFAYEDYKNNPYLTGGGEEQFLKEYGFSGGNEDEKNN